MEAFNTLSIRLRICLLAGLCMAATVMMLVGTSLYLSAQTATLVKNASTDMLRDDAKLYLEEVARSQSRQASAHFQRAADFGETLARQLMRERALKAASNINEADVRQAISDALAEHVRANSVPFGVGVAFEPDTIDPRFVNTPFAGNEKGRFAVYQSTHIPSYTIPEKEIVDDGTNATYWYKCALQQAHTCLTPPYLYTDASGVNTLMATVAVPLSAAGSVRGVMSVDISLASLQIRATDFAKQLYEGSSRVLLISEDGIIAADSRYPEHLARALSAIDPELSQLVASQAGKNAVTIQQHGQDMLAIVSFDALGGSRWVTALAVPMAMLLAPSTNLASHLDDVSAANTRSQLLLGALVAFIALALIAWLGQSISRPITEVAQALDDIADGDGDLTRRLQHKREDEVGKLVSAFNRFLDKLQPIIAAVSRSANETHDTAQQASSIAADSSSNMQQQFREIDMVATASQEMTATSHDVARNAAQAADATTRVEAATQEGLQAIEQANAMIAELARHIDDTLLDVSGLASSSEQIGGVLEVIRSIAEQTNLLALNAAIEAARAGESGRGFAVVADEVRHLARRTQESVSEIREVIEKLQSGTLSVVNAMQHSHAQVATSVEHVTQTSHVLGKISGAVDLISDMNLQIASAAEEQSAVSEEVSKTVVAIRDVTRELAASSERAAVIGRSLNEMANQQQALMASFKA